MAGFLVGFAAELALVGPIVALQVLLKSEARVLGRDEACWATRLRREKHSLKKKGVKKKTRPTIVSDEDGLLQGDVRQR